MAVTEGLVELLARGVDGPGEPGIVDWQELRAEALVRLGRLHLADALPDRDGRGCAGSRAPFRRGGRRPRARPAGDRAQTPCGCRALVLQCLAHAFGDLGYTFARARTLLDWGTAAREWGQAASSARLLGEAASEFSRLEARPFLARLPAVPGAAVDPPDAPQLRPQELAIALLVAQGRTNREIAQELMLSVKTVELHLSQVFRRHQLRSRSQLAALVSRSSRPGSPHPP